MNHYRINFQLLENHGYSLKDIEGMMPWEREIYLALLMEEIKLKNELRAQQG